MLLGWPGALHFSANKASSKNPQRKLQYQWEAGSCLTLGVNCLDSSVAIELSSLIGKKPMSQGSSQDFEINLVLLTNKWAYSKETK